MVTTMERMREPEWEQLSGLRLEHRLVQMLEPLDRLLDSSSVLEWDLNIKQKINHNVADEIELINNTKCH